MKDKKVGIKRRMCVSGVQIHDHLDIAIFKGICLANYLERAVGIMLYIIYKVYITLI